MSLPVRRNWTLAAGAGADDSKSGLFQCLSLELLFKIAEKGLGLADFLNFATTNKDLFSKLIGRLFEQGMNTNKAPLQWACIRNGRGPDTVDTLVQLHPQGRQLLSDYFTHDDVANVIGQTPLILAIRAANFRVVKRLLKYGVDGNQPERSASYKSTPYRTLALWSPIHFAVGYDLIPDSLPQRLGCGKSPRLRENIVRHLLQKGAVSAGKHTKAADPCAVMSPLFLHITNGPSNVRNAIIFQLLRHGAEATQSSLYRVQWIPEITRMVSPLSLLISQCRREKHVPDEVMLVVPLLISAGDGGGKHTTSGAPLLMECLNPCENMRWAQITEMLLSSRRQSASAVNTEGEPVVVWLIIRLLYYELWFRYDHLYAIKMEKQNKWDMVRACTNSMLQLLLRHGADINARCPASHREYPGATALIIAASIRDELHDVFLDLLESGVDAKARDSKGQSAFFGLFAGKLSNPNDRIQALSEAGASINAADQNGDTVLHYAAKHSRRHFSSWLPKLLAHGCDLDKRNDIDETFIDVLCKKVQPDQLETTRNSILEDIQQAKENAIKVKRQEKTEKYRLKAAAAAEKHQKRRDAAEAAHAAARVGHNSIGQSSASAPQTGHSIAQVGPSAAQVSGHSNTSQNGSRTTQAGPKCLRVSDKNVRIGPGATQAGASTGPVATPNQRRPNRGVRRIVDKTTHKPIQAGPSTPRSYATTVQASLGDTQAGSRIAAQVATHTTLAFPSAALSGLVTDSKPPGF